MLYIKYCTGSEALLADKETATAGVGKHTHTSPRVWRISLWKKRKVVASLSIHISSEGGYEELSVEKFPYKSQKVSDQWIEKTIFQTEQEACKSEVILTEDTEMTSMWI